MLYENRQDVQIKVPVTTPTVNREELQIQMQSIANDPTKKEAFKEAAAAAGLIGNQTSNQPTENKPPYLLIGGALLISYFLFFK
jgi:hypothetical protein